MKEMSFIWLLLNINTNKFSKRIDKITIKLFVMYELGYKELFSTIYMIQF